jgi:hypothetical protein
MNYSKIVAKIVSKSSFVILSAVACATLVATDASAQRRGGGGGGGRSSGGGTAVGRAAPRGTVPGGIGGPRGISPRIIGRAPYYPYYYRPGISLGFYVGSPFYYGYPYGYYGYGYGYPYSYYGARYGYYGYPGYGYGAYGYPGAGYGYGSSGAYGSVRIQGAPREAEVYADGYYVGIVDDFDGAFHHLDLTPGAHNVEIRAPGLPPTAFEVNIQPGRTVTFHVR